MPGKYRYSATFDATYLEEDSSPSNTLVTVSSWRSSSSSERVSEHPLGGGSNNSQHARSGSVDSLDSNGGSSGSSSVGHSRQVSTDGEFIPTRTMTKAATKPAHNPLQFVKVGQCPLYKQAEQQLKLAKEVKCTREKLKDVEEEWQSNLDNWKSRRKKATEKVIQRAEEMRQIEIEEQLRQQARKTKTFSEMLEERSQRKRYNLSIYSDPGDEEDSIARSSGSMSNNGSEDLRPSVKSQHETNGNSLDNAASLRSSLEKLNSSNSQNGTNKCNAKPHDSSTADQNQYRFSSEDELEYKDEISDSNSRLCNVPCDRDAHKDASKDDGSDGTLCGNIDSGLESLNSSQRAGDVPDSASDFSQDSASVIDKNTEDELETQSVVGEMTTGTEMLEEFSSRNQSNSPSTNCEPKKEDGMELNLRIWLRHCPEAKDFGFTMRDTSSQEASVIIDSVISGSASDIAGLKTGDEVLAINGEDTRGRSHPALVFAVKQSLYIGQLDLLVWRPAKQDDSGFQCEDSAPPKNKRAAAFEEKRALFTSVPSGRSRSASERKIDSKNKDNLVTRRRSTFENIFQEKDDAKDGHASSDVTPPSNFRERLASFEKKTHKQNGESKHQSKNEAPRKPPPIPIKPKLKPRTSSESSLRTDNYADSVSSGSDVTCDDSMSNGAVHSRDCSLGSENEMYVDDIDQLPYAVPNKTASTSAKPPSSDACSEPAVSECSVGSNQESGAESPTKVSVTVEELPKPQEPKIIGNSSPTHSQGSLQETTSTTNTSSDENVTPTRFVTLHPVQDCSGLHIIYQSLPKQHNVNNTNNEAQNDASGAGLNTSLHSPTSQASSNSEPCGVESSTSPEKQCENSISLQTAEDSKTIACNGDYSAHKNTKEKEPTNSAPSTADKILSDCSPVQDDGNQDDILFEDLVAPPKHIEPPKEKPPPPPVEDVQKIGKQKAKDSTPISAKQIKKELWKRRSNFLGLGEKGSMPDLENSNIRPPPAIEDILKTEREMERLHRQQLEQQILVRSHEVDDEIARKEREIIENLEREEKERQEQDGEKEEQELFMAGQSATHLAEDEERIKRLQEERRRMEEERIQTEEQRMRLEEQRQQHEKISPPETIISKHVPQNKEQKKPNLSENKDLSTKEPHGQNKILHNGTPSAPIPIPTQPEKISVPHLPSGPIGRGDIISASRQPQGMENFMENNYSYSPSKTTLLSPDPPAKPPRSDPRYCIESPSHHPQVMTRQSLHSVGVTPKAKIGQNEHWLKAEDQQPATKRRSDPSPRERGYNQNHWLVQEAEIRRLKEQDERRRLSNMPERWQTLPDTRHYDPLQKPLSATVDDFGVPPLRNHRSSYDSLVPFYPSQRVTVQSARLSQQYPVEQEWNYGHTAPFMTPSRSFSGHQASPYNHERCYSQSASPYERKNHASTMHPHPGLRPSRSMPDMQEQMLSVSGKKKCSHCGNELGRGAAMIIESLQLYYHIHCFCCCVCQAQLGNGSCGTDVRVRNNKLHCQNCYSNDEAGLKFSRV